MYDRIKDLVCAAKEGDRASKEALLDQFRPLILHCVRHYAWGLDREEMLQEGALLLLKAIDSYDPERRVPFPAYLRARMHYGIHNLARARRKVLYTPIPLGEREPLDPNPGPEALLEQKDIRHRLRTAINTLNPKEKQLVLYHFIKGCTLKTTADTLKITYKSARTLKKKALQNLKKHL